MKKLIIILFIFLTAAGYAQTYPNSWINYSQTYYKFPIGRDGICRITESTLNSLGLGAVPAEQFQLWRNGTEVPLYTSVPSGPMSSTDYLEFFGRMNDGKPDTKLYRVADYQLQDHYSLESDTAAYYLTVNPTGATLRYANAPNNDSGTTLTPEPYFMNRQGVYFRDKVNPGYAVPVGEYVYSSSYDIGEGWTSNDILPGRPQPVQFNNLNLYYGGPNASLYYTVAGNALNQRSVQVVLNNAMIDDEPLPWFTYLKKQLTNINLNVPPAQNYILFNFQDSSAQITDRYVISEAELTYPSTFNFNNQTSFYFELPATITGNYLVINSFNYGSTAPVLFDITDGQRYIGDITTPGQVKFVLPPSALAVRKFVISSEDNSVINNISSLQQRNFINYGVAANQGNYLIISNPALYTSSTGANNVDLYRQYRSSALGGGFNVSVININELIDQFAYGINKDPAAIKDFIQYAKATYSPQYVFLIGKGITYDEYVTNQNSIYDNQLNLVPTFGYPASDVLLSSPYGSIVPSIPIGRLSAISGNEVGNYLQKIETYEQAQNSTIQTQANKLWMKQIVHVIGGSDQDESDLFTFYMNQYANIIQDTLYGGTVATFTNSSTAAVQLLSGQQITQLFNSGISMLTYFGHASATVLEYNLGSPSTYTFQGRYPFFLVSGCTAGNNYIFDTLRVIQDNLTISENWVLSGQQGAIGFLADTYLGIPPYLNNYDDTLYTKIGIENYGASIGNDMQSTISALGGSNPNIDFYTRMHLEEMALHGDPALKINPQPKPDYVVENEDVVINPQFISVSQNSFQLNATAYNLGRAINDSITFQVTRTYPNGTTAVILRKRVLLYYSDSISLSIPIVATRDLGLNKITVTINADNDVSEITTTNNSVTEQFYIYQDEATPAYPYNYAIVNIQNQKLYASTANPVSLAANYEMDIDTTELFNSPLKVTRTVNQIGGILQFDPGINYVDSVVYYWRVALVPVSGLASAYHWNNSSFIYLPNSSTGSNQSQYFQQLASDTLNIHLDSTSRLWKFSTVLNYFELRNGVYPTASTQGSDFTAGVNGANFSVAICPNGINNTLIFNVLDPVSLLPWTNVLGGASGLSSSLSVCEPGRINNFAYNVADINQRKAAMNFLDSIPNNDIVMVRNIVGPDSASIIYPNTWEGDTTVFGSGNSLYERLLSQGFVLIDSFYRPRAFAFIYQKNNLAFGPNFIFSQGTTDIIDFKKNYVSPDTLGYITSPQFGPATSWKQMHWRGTSLESNSPDNPTVQIIGIDTLGNSTTLFNVNKTQQDVDISSVSAAHYPYIQLKMRNIDSIFLTPYQLSYWRLNYTPAPEGAIAPNIFFTCQDTLQQGDTLHFGIPFKNISPQSFDSVKVNLSVIDNNNVTHVFPIPRQKPLVPGDTIALRYNIPTKGYSGTNTLLVYFNPNKDQPEEYLFNNFLYQNFYVETDQYNPLLDVTFDGVHILNRDIVSARPHIIIKLKDENKSLALNDTSLIQLQLAFPDGSLRTYNFNNDSVRFTPANLAAGQNTATIDFTPSLAGNDAYYELIVGGRDVVGNHAGALNYKVDFRVFNTEMISNLLNYPNPFTTSTAFVFTLTGSVVPQNIRIEIMTITGKIIKEITKDELGPLNIGTNITQYKWNGTDMYGQKVANGVYLYRVLTNLNGHSLGKFTDTDNGENTNQYFTKGYGKMYFMR